MEPKKGREPSTRLVTTVSRTKTQSRDVSLARVFFVGENSPYPGWYVQRYTVDELVTSRLPVKQTGDAYEAVRQAAALLDCIPDQIQVEGAAWPPRRQSH